MHHRIVRGLGLGLGLGLLLTASRCLLMWLIIFTCACVLFHFCAASDFVLMMWSGLNLSTLSWYSVSRPVGMRHVVAAQGAVHSTRGSTHGVWVRTVDPTTNTIGQTSAGSLGLRPHLCTATQCGRAKAGQRQPKECLYLELQTAYCICRYLLADHTPSRLVHHQR